MDHTTLYSSAVVTRAINSMALCVTKLIALSRTIFELFDVQNIMTDF